MLWWIFDRRDTKVHQLPEGNWGLGSNNLLLWDYKIGRQGAAGNEDCSKYAKQYLIHECPFT
jgi:hypothetical protein